MRWPRFSLDTTLSTGTEKEWPSYGLQNRYSVRKFNDRSEKSGKSGVRDGVSSRWMAETQRLPCPAPSSIPLKNIVGWVYTRRTDLTAWIRYEEPEHSGVEA
jgi:hypothetical protein